MWQPASSSATLKWYYQSWKENFWPSHLYSAKYESANFKAKQINSDGTSLKEVYHWIHIIYAGNNIRVLRSEELTDKRSQ